MSEIALTSNHVVTMFTWHRHSHSTATGHIHSQREIFREEVTDEMSFVDK